MRTLFMISVFVCGAMTSCRSGNLGDVYAKGEKRGVCPVHHLPMTITAVSVGYGYYVSPADGPDPKFVASHFPFAQRSAMGGCLIIVGEPRKTIELYQCPNCERAKLDWIASHPQSDWAREEMTTYEHASKLRGKEDSNKPTPENPRS